MNPSKRRSIDASGLCIESATAWFSLLDHLTYANRFVLDRLNLAVVRDAEPCLGEILDACMRRTTILPPGTTLYRSRVHPPARRLRQPVFTIDEMRAPPWYLATGARLNPEGIPYLYLSTDELTAIAEQRPWRGAPIAVATFELTEDIRVYDLMAPSEDNSMENFVIRKLGQSFSTPAHRDDRAAYGATQFISEHLKAVGADETPPIRGVQYPSALQPNGVNVALFGSGDTDNEWPGVKGLEDVRLWKVKDVAIEAEPSESR